MKYRSEGEEEGLKIRAAAQGEKHGMLAEAYKVGEQHRGAGRSRGRPHLRRGARRGTGILPLRRTLDASRKFVTEGTTMVLPANSELFGLLYDSDLL